jgi:hypothetical protein
MKESLGNTMRAYFWPYRSQICAPFLVAYYGKDIENSFENSLIDIYDTTKKPVLAI